MKLDRIGVFLFCIALSFMACNQDDNGDVVPTITVRDRGEQQVLDIDSLETYLKNNYYNSEDFIGVSNPKISDLVIQELADGETAAPDGHTILWDELETTENPDGKLKPINTTFADTDYDFYFLKLNEGGGEKSPTFADNVVVNYEGTLLDNDVFDSAVTPVTFDLTTLVAGWGKVLTSFKIAETGPTINGDGTITYENHGVGAMFLPSGLAYYSAPPANSGIAAYRCLVFKFDLYDTSENDHDNDGIPSYLEDLNGDGFFTVNSLDLSDETDDDTDGNNFPNYFDADDDGDGTPTADEITTRSANAATMVALEALVGTNEFLKDVTMEMDGSYSGTIVDLDPDDDGTQNYLDENS